MTKTKANTEVYSNRFGHDAAAENSDKDQQWQVPVATVLALK